MEVWKEKTTLSTEDCFMVMKRSTKTFAYPIHIHPEFELNYLENANGAIRIVEDSIEEIGELEMVLIAGGTKHAYSNNKCKFENVSEITIQFHRSMFESLLPKRHFDSIRYMFENAEHGLVFSRETILKVQPILKMISNDIPDSFQNVLRLFDILKTLSGDESARRLNASENTVELAARDYDRLEAIMLYMHENYQKNMSLAEVASFANMSETSLTRFLKRWAGRSFIDILNEIRIASAARRLIDTSDTISEICYKSGFNNLSNFNRIFKKRKNITPTEYRDKHSRTRFKV